MPPIGYLEAGVNGCRVFSLFDPLSAFHIIPVTNETSSPLTSSLSSHYIKMFRRFLFVSTNFFRPIVMCKASIFADVILSLNVPWTATNTIMTCSCGPKELSCYVCYTFGAHFLFKMIAFWNIAPCSLVEVHLHFRGANDLLQRDYMALYPFFFFPVPGCAITASGVPGGTFVSMNRFSTLCGWLVQRQGWRVRVEYDRVSMRDRLKLTPDLTTRDLWRGRRWAREGGNFVYSSPWDFKSSFTCRKILRYGTFQLYFPSERKVCCVFYRP
jgi:hypothetical protein